MTAAHEATRHRVYLLTLYGVYDHGTCGVFTTREAAETHAEALGSVSDGYHGFRINEVEVDQPISEGLPLTMSTTRWRTHDRPTAIEFHPWPGAGEGLEQ